MEAVCFYLLLSFIVTAFTSRYIASNYMMTDDERKEGRKAETIEERKKGGKKGRKNRRKEETNEERKKGGKKGRNDRGEEERREERKKESKKGGK